MDALVFPPPEVEPADAIAAGLAAMAAQRTDFQGDLTATLNLTQLARASLEAAADLWAGEHGYRPHPHVIDAATPFLVSDGLALLHRRDQAERDAQLDAIEAGDLRQDGSPIPYARYP